MQGQQKPTLTVLWNALKMMYSKIHSAYCLYMIKEMGGGAAVVPVLSGILFPLQKSLLANHIDRIHKGCTTASLVSCSTSATSGILTILGLTLALITAGGSLILTATGIGLGAGATAIGLSAALYENIINVKEKKRAEGLVNACEKMVAKRIKINVKAWKTAQTHLKTLAKQAANAGRSSWSRFKNSKDITKAFSGPTLAMAKGARMLNAVSAGVFLLVDAYGLVQDAKHLMKGGKAEIRKKATLFEEELQNLSKLYNELKDLDLPSSRGS
uniref:Apolipoprotein L3 n=1 Tax=Naja naja TaxID=35670 RepID=A0A8C6XEH4_NAJNA